MEERRATILRLVSRNYPSLKYLEEVLRLNHMSVSDRTIKRDIAKLRKYVDIKYSYIYKGYYIEYVYRPEVVDYYKSIIPEAIEAPQYAMPY